MRLLKGSLVASLLGMTSASLAASPKTPELRRIAVRIPEGFALGTEFERVTGWAKRRGFEVDVRPEAAPVPKGWEAVYLARVPVSDRSKTALARFPVSFEAAAFVFDGRTYEGRDDAIFLADPAKPAETFVIGLSEHAAVDLASRRVFWREADPADYEAVSGGLSKEGRFVAKDGRLAIDRASDRDRLAAREDFFRALRREKRGVVEWEHRESEAAAVAKWERTAARFAGKRPFSVRLFPDAVTKGMYTGSSRPADLASVPGGVRVDIDVAAPEEPDLVSPVLAAAALAAAEPALLEHRTLLLAAGARRVGRWWGREVKGFAAFTSAAGVEPSLDEVIHSSEDVSPVLAIGSAAAWLDAGARLDGEKAVDQALGSAEGGLREKLSRWRIVALRQSVKPPARRTLPAGFLRGVSYAMTNSIEGAYVAPQSLAALKRLRDDGADSISVVPYAFAREAGSDEILFVHRSAQGETDEGTVRAVVDARSLGMTAMVKPQIWVGGGASVGDLAMKDERSWPVWFASYRRFIVHHAVVAEAAGVDLFCAGSELMSTEAHEKQWREVFAVVRLATGAPLVYAANWAANAPRATFWDALDAIGVDFYDPLAKAEKASDAALEQGVRAAVRPVADLAARAGKPVIFTEAGYAALRSAWIAPRDEDASRPAAGEDAARAIAAVYRALARESWWKGVYWWKALSDGKVARPGDRGFNFVGTPSEKAIADGFRAIPAGPAPPRPTP